MTDFPVLFFLVCFVLLWLAAQVGVALQKRRSLKDPERDDFAVVQAATLTLLGLIIGFTFSMAISRYDLRKNYEEAEANAIGTEYLRVGLLPPADAKMLRSRLRQYTQLRIEFYQRRRERGLDQIRADTAWMQVQMWSVIEADARAQPTAPMTLVAAGMNDVLSSEGYTQAAWWNRIPASAWGLMLAIAICCNVLIGYGLHSARVTSGLLMVLPLVVSIAFFLIADIDSPRHGLIAVSSQNLIRLAQSMPR